MYNNGGAYDGVGYVFAADGPYTGVDVDHCIDEDGTIDGAVRANVTALASYTELSQSHRGLHVILRARKPSGASKREPYEVYEQGRYFAITGDVLPDMATTIEDRSAALSEFHRRVIAAGTLKQTGPTSRHETLKKLGVRLRKAGCGHEAVLAQLRTTNKAFDESKTDDEVRNLAGWVTDNVEPAAAEPQRSQADRLVGYAFAAGVECVRDAQGEPYARVPHAEGGHAVYPMRSKSFGHWLGQNMYKAEQRAPNVASVTDARSLLAGIALHDTTSRVADVALRVAYDRGDIVLDLGDDLWRCVRITADGCRVEPHGQLLFRRSATMRALPEPQFGGNLRALREHIRCDDDSWPLLASCLIASAVPSGPYPILVLTGEQGAGKTTAARMVRGLLDPSVLAVRSEPRDGRDLMIAARHSHVIALDNLSRIPSAIANALCCLATGGGFGARELYSDAEETAVAVARPIILTSIEDVATRPDLLDRSLIVRLHAIPKRERKTERDLWTAFETDTPVLLGALCEALSLMLRQLPIVIKKSPALERMADYHLRALAAESAYTQTVKFNAAYQTSREGAHGLAIEDSVIVEPLELFVKGLNKWAGTATELLQGLNDKASDEKRRRKEWPRNAHLLSGALRLIAPSLRATGWIVELDGRSGHKRTRTIRLSHPENVDNGASAASAGTEDLNNPRLSARTLVSGDQRPHASTPSAEHAQVAGSERTHADAR
ncbi:MAG: hypothetical protein GIX03_01865 [Candidatus Eremiobacteraeota bacterium]|nr:hypothetical protein [Candidatus Eremiobacteraeota bacterium]MBC5801765.1 hypothetical protein [Candidatus Eremiobacteraeota bacterium]MBC5823063.1 hypothetical protein [Candidatus Eremiobacteraeota bacterium]